MWSEDARNDRLGTVNKQLLSSCESYSSAHIICFMLLSRIGILDFYMVLAAAWQSDLVRNMGGVGVGGVQTGCSPSDCVVDRAAGRVADRVGGRRDICQQERCFEVIFGRVAGTCVDSKDDGAKVGAKTRETGGRVDKEFSGRAG